MPLTVTCPGCQSPLRVREEYVGKKLKCPRCEGIIEVPGAETPEDIPEVQFTEPPAQNPAEHVAEVRPAPLVAPPHGESATAVGEGPPEVRPVARGPGHERGEDQDYDRGRRRRRRIDYRPCPRCGSGGARAVTWTPWGSFYGPAMLNHVRCPKCDYAYNGKTGRSNAVGIAFFVLIFLLLVVGLDVAMWFLFEQYGPLMRWFLLGLFALEAVVGGVLLLLSVLRPAKHSSGGHRREDDGGDQGSL